MAKSSNWVDLESTPFEENWLLYANVAKHMSNNGYNVMVSTHEEMLTALDQLKVNHTVVIPPLADKATYRKRYIQRGNTQDFIDNVMNNWDTWLRRICCWPSVLKTIIILPSDGCLQAFAEGWKDGKEE